MCSFLQGALLVFVLAGYGLYEYARWELCKEECQVRHVNAHKLLNSEVCKGAFGESVEAACSKAQLEMRTLSWVCSSVLWWNKSWMHFVSSRITESYVMLGALILLPILYAIKRTFDHFGESRAEERMERLLSTQRMLPMLQSIPTYSRGVSEEEEEVQHPRVLPRTRSIRSNFVYNP